MTTSDGTDVRRVESRERQGEPVLVVVLEHTYDTTPEDLWDAITSRERIERWCLPVTGELKLGGRYQLEGNAEGTITRCDRPQSLELTWEFGGYTSWVTAEVNAQEGSARLTLEHIAPHVESGAEYYETYGPGAGGVGWDLWLRALALHLDSPEQALDNDAMQAWTQSPQGKAFIRAAGEAWAEADVANGTELETANARAERTIAFYTGE